MTPATLLLIIQGIEAAIAAAPQVIDVAEKGKALIASLFEAGAITIDQQNTTHAHIDAIQAAVIAGIVPPSWTVEADPGSAPAASAAPQTTAAAASPATDSASEATQSDATVAAEKSAVEGANTPAAPAQQ